MCKIINLNATAKPDDDFIPLEKARYYIRGRKGEIIKRKSLLQKIYRNQFPEGTYTKSMRGNYFISKSYLLGFKSNNAA
ncbi:MAG: hypothetical protein ACTHJ5_13710 [Ilyomonas sp.]